MKKVFGVKAIMSAMLIMSMLAGCTPADNTKKASETTQAQQASSEETKKESEKETTKESETTKAANDTAGSGKKKIAVVQLLEHTSLNIIHDALMDELKNLGYIDGENVIIDYKNAQGELSNLPSIMQVYEGNKQDVVVAIATPVAQAAMGIAKTTPVVFTAITDPIGAGVVSALDKTDKGMTGTSDAVQIGKIMELALKITPDAKTFGYIYNPGENNSVHNLELLKEFAKEHDLTIVESSISSASELQTAASTLLSNVDALFVANDNTVASAMPVLMQEVIKAKKPIYVGADSMVMDGGFATMGIDYEDLGRESARMVDQVLKGKDVSEIPVKVFKDDLFIYVNTDTAKALGIEIPDEIKNDPKFVEIHNKTN